MLVFARNFRGFRQIDLDLESEIFLVGDNSSGKTSILHLLDYVFRTDLLGLPKLNEEFHVSKADFFSPYFDYADVTIGFQTKIESRPAYRIITIMRLQSGMVYVTKVTHATPGGSLIIKSGIDGVSAKFVDSSDLSLEDAIELHESNNDEFVDLDNSEKSQVNSSASIFSAVYALSVPIEKARYFLSISIPGCRHIGPMRAKSETFYLFDRKIQGTGAHFVSLLEDLPRKQRSAALKAISKFGKESGLFDEFSVKPISRKVIESPLVATVKRRGKEFFLNQVGIGVSQVAPILVDTQVALSGWFEGSKFILLEQPELHLHPVAQAALGEYIYSMAKLGVRFVIETHSDYLIDRYRAKMKEGKKSPPAKIIYCHQTKKGEPGNLMLLIDIDKHGRLVDAPPAYHEFYLKELTRTMF